MKLADQIGPVLPQLRRYARALSGSQASGDTYVRVMLETLIAEPQRWREDLSPRVAGFSLFHQVWSAIGQDIAAAAPDASGTVTVADARLASLAPVGRQALLLTAMEGFSRAEAALILGRDEGEIGGLIDDVDGEIKEMTRSKVLIIEDEPIIAMDIESLVEDLGHDVLGICATRGEALAACEKAQPDLVLADIQLADGSSGIDAAADILKQFQVPVIFITAFPESLLTGRQVEPTFLITKPFQSSAVRAAVSQALFFKQNARAAG